MIKFITDTTSCLSLAEAQQLGIGYIPQIIVFGEETFRDDTEMDARAFVKRLRVSPLLPKTAAPPPALYHPLYREYLSQGHSVIVICPSAEVSGTFRSATVGLQEISAEFPNADIHIIDTRRVASGLSMIVKQALRWANEGCDANTIVEKVQEMSKRERVYFMVDTMEYLYKGGRIGAAKALMGSILQMKPILAFGDGHIEGKENQRTHKKAVARLKEMILEDCPRSPESYLSIMHGDVEDEARKFAADMARLLDIPVENIPIVDLTPAILVHGGPGIIGASYFVAK